MLSVTKINPLRKLRHKYARWEISHKILALAYVVVRNRGRNITITRPSLLGGGEYAKTYGHYHHPPYDETYQVLSGQAGFLIQKLAGDKVKEVILQVVLPGEKFTVPAGY